MRKFITILLSIVIAMQINVTASHPITPAPLKNGDKIMILAPAGIVNPKYVDNACEILRKWGFNPIVSDHCKGSVKGYSGTAEDRLSDLRKALSDPEIKAILCARGGYGAVHLVESLPADSLCKYPKWLIGYSDISVLHAMMVNAGIKSIHGPMSSHLSELKGQDPCSIALKDIITGTFPTYNFEKNPLNRLGEASGELVGGNLAVLTGLVGSEIDLLKKGSILFIEDVEEPTYKLERMLYTLQLNGVLPSLNGLIVGHFTNCKPNAAGETIYDIISRLVADYSYPVVYNFPVGHEDTNYPLIEGAEVKLSVTDTGTTLKFINK